MNILKPCPRCNETISTKFILDGIANWHVICPSCYLITKDGAESRQGARRQWNCGNIVTFDDYLVAHSFARNGDEIMSIGAKECVLVEDESEEEFYPVAFAKCSSCGEVFPSASNFLYCPSCGTKVLITLPLKKGEYNGWGGLWID